MPRRKTPELPVGPGERLLAWTAVDDGMIGGTRDAFYLRRGESADTLRIPWEQVEAADWDFDASVLRVSEVGSWGAVRPVHEVSLAEPGRLLELVRERVTASVVLQRHIAINGSKGVRVIARRAPRGTEPVQWIYEFDEGIDPSSAPVRAAAESALLAAQEELGLA